MRGPRRRSLSTLAAALCVAAVASWAMHVSPAEANGDPASDVLYSTDIYYPSTETVPQATTRALDTIVREARRRGRPIKVVLIATRTDLGTAASLMGYPDRYAGFLTTELGKYVTAPVLIVTPHGFGLGRSGRILSTKPLDGIESGADPDSLARAAVEGVSRLTATPAPKLPDAGASGNGGDTAPIVAGAVVLALLGAAATYLLTRRRRGRG
jgi:hypothetical protein